MQTTLLDTRRGDVITVLITPSFEREKFAHWLKDAGSTENTVRCYCAKAEAWFDKLASDPSVMPAKVWMDWKDSESVKRQTGYACRRYAEFMKATVAQDIDFGIPSRLPAASRPKPHAVTGSELKALYQTARQILPYPTNYSFRVWLLLCEELGLRRQETDFEWLAFNEEQESLTVTGKTGTRELPLSKKMLRRLRWLKNRHSTSPWGGCRGRLRVDSLYNIFKKVAVTAGLSHLRPHHLRHRRLTALCRSSLGKNQLLVLSFSGHSHVSSLQYYYEVSLSEKRALLNASKGIFAATA